jgi:hypothetical protein
MKLREKISGQIFDTPSEVARNLIASGLCEAVVEERKPTTIKDFLFGRTPNTQWSVGYIRDGFDSGTLVIAAKCSCCKQSMTWSGTSILKTAQEDRNRFSHCGASQVIPADILKKYARLLPQTPVTPMSPACREESPMVRLFSGSRREDETTEYQVSDPQQI